MEVVKLVMSHIDPLKMRFTVGNFTTKWLRLEKGFMAGCTISVALFVTAMNLLYKVEGKQWKAPVVYYDTRGPACRAFMDDISVMTSLIQGTQ